MKKNIECEKLRICLLAIVEKLSNYGTKQIIRADEMKFAIKWLFDMNGDFDKELNKFREIKKLI